MSQVGRTWEMNCALADDMMSATAIVSACPEHRDRKAVSYSQAGIASSVAKGAPSSR